MFYNHRSPTFKVPRMRSPILIVASDNSAKEEEVKWREFMDNHHELCDISKCLGKRINGLYACQFANLPGSMYSQYLRHRRRLGSYKTKPCRYVYEQRRNCLAGDDCPFYHNIEEKRDIPQPTLQPAAVFNFDVFSQHNLDGERELLMLDAMTRQVQETTERMFKQVLNTEEFLRALDNHQQEKQPNEPNKQKNVESSDLWGPFSADFAASLLPVVNGNQPKNPKEYPCYTNGLFCFDSGVPSSEVLSNWGDCSTSSHSNSPPRVGAAFSRTIGPKKKSNSVTEAIPPKALSFDPFAEFYPLKDLAIVGTHSFKADEQNCANWEK